MKVLKGVTRSKVKQWLTMCISLGCNYVDSKQNSIAVVVRTLPKAKYSHDDIVATHYKEL